MVDLSRDGEGLQPPEFKDPTPLLADRRRRLAIARAVVGLSLVGGIAALYAVLTLDPGVAQQDRITWFVFVIMILLGPPTMMAVGPLSSPASVHADFLLANSIPFFSIFGAHGLGQIFPKDVRIATEVGSSRMSLLHVYGPGSLYVAFNSLAPGEGYLQVREWLHDNAIAVQERRIAEPRSRI